MNKLGQEYARELIRHLRELADKEEGFANFLAQDSEDEGFRLFLSKAGAFQQVADKVEQDWGFC